MSAGESAALRFVPVAETGTRFAGFGVYVPAVRDDGLVSFWAQERAGGSGIFAAAGGSVRPIARSSDGLFDQVLSHPDVDGDGRCCFYARLAHGGAGVVLCDRAGPGVVADSPGPLGPTCSENGHIAFRRSGPGGAESIVAMRDGVAAEIAATGARFAAFHGLPVINRRGLVAFRADLAAGGHGVFVAGDDAVRAAAETGAEFAALGHFPSINDSGAVAFTGVPRPGGSALLVDAAECRRTILDSGAAFESIRGALLNNRGVVAFFATPRGGTLGVFTGPDPAADCLLSLGSDYQGSVVTDFALNPVSVNNRGQVAARVRVEDGREFIACTEGIEPADGFGVSS